MRSGVLESPSGNLSVGVRIRPMLLGIRRKGDQAFYWNSLLRYTRNRVMIRPILVSPISPVSHYGSGQNWYRWKATIMKNPTPSVARILDQNSQRTSGFTGKQPRGLR